MSCTPPTMYPCSSVRSAFPYSTSLFLFLSIPKWNHLTVKISPVGKIPHPLSLSSAPINWDRILVNYSNCSWHLFTRKITLMNAAPFNAYRKVGKNKKNKNAITYTYNFKSEIVNNSSKDSWYFITTFLKPKGVKLEKSVLQKGFEIQAS